MTGEDEIMCANRTCAGHLRCRDETICVHHDNICDGIIHCRTWHDNELYCSITTCSSHCVCQGNSMKCDNTLPDPVTYFTNDVRQIILQDMILEKTNIFAGTPYLQYLTLINCYMSLHAIRHSLTKITQFIEILVLKQANISALVANSFQHLTKLSYLSFVDIKITKIQPRAFNGLSSITNLQLSNISLYALSSCGFCFAKKLNNLDISQ